MPVFSEQVLSRETDLLNPTGCPTASPLQDEVGGRGDLLPHGHSGDFFLLCS
jgi:hypothetical protein